MSGIYQDWEPVVIHNKKFIANKNNDNNKPKPKINYNKGDEEMPKRIEYTPEMINALQAARTANKLSQADLAKKLNMQVKIINDIESRTSQYNRQLYTNIMKKLGVDIKSLKDILI
jgi:ribosome-binding protein aMBF1 (putative translation factor)